MNFLTNLNDVILTSSRDIWDKVTKSIKSQKLPTITNVYNNNHNFVDVSTALMAQFDHEHRIIRSWKHKLEAVHNTMNVNIEILTSLITQQDFNSISRTDLRIELVKGLRALPPSSSRIISKHEPTYIVYHKLTFRDKQLHCKQCQESQIILQYLYYRTYSL